MEKKIFKNLHSSESMLLESPSSSDQKKNVCCRMDVCNSKITSPRLTETDMVAPCLIDTRTKADDRVPERAAVELQCEIQHADQGQHDTSGQKREAYELDQKETYGYVRSQHLPSNETTMRRSDAIMTLDASEFEEVKTMGTFLFLEVANPQNEVITLNSVEANTLLRVSKNEDKSKRVGCGNSTTIQMSNNQKTIQAKVEISKKGSDSLVLLNKTKDKQDKPNDSQNNSKTTQKKPTVYIHGCVLMSASSLSGTKFNILQVNLMDRDGKPFKDKGYRYQLYDRNQLYPSTKINNYDEGKKFPSCQTSGGKRERGKKIRGESTASFIRQPMKKWLRRERKNKVYVKIAASISKDMLDVCKQGHISSIDRMDYIKTNISTMLKEEMKYTVEEVYTSFPDSIKNQNEGAVVSRDAEWTICFRFPIPYYHDDGTPNFENHAKCSRMCLGAFQNVFHEDAIYMGTEPGSIIVRFKIEAYQVIKLIQKRLAFRAFFIKNSKIKKSDGKGHDEGLVPTISIWNQRTASLQTRESFPKDIKIQLACSDKTTADNIIRSIKENEEVWRKFSIKAVFIDGNKKNISNKRENRETFPLHAAAKNGNLALLCSLLEKKIRIEEKDDQGWTPLHHAASNGNVDIVQFLVEEMNANVLAEDHCQKTPSDVAFGKAKKYLLYGETVHSRRY